MKKGFFLIVVCISATLVAVIASQNTKNNSFEGQIAPSVALPDDTLSLNVFHSSAFPALFVRRKENDTTSVPLRASSLHVDVKVVGMMSATTMEMIFYNDLDRVLEGQFYFPLGEGQTVSGFAMEVEGKMREGVVVEKAKGRQVFESVVRRKIDPGLLEWTKGNNYRARIFPIPAKGTKKIRITFEQELLPSAKAFTYFLPMQFKDKVDEFSVHAEVVKQTIKPEPAEDEITTLQFEKWNDSWVADKVMKDFMPDKPLAFEIPRTGILQQVFTEKTGGREGEKCFYFACNPEKYVKEKKLPVRICLLWDASGSSVGRNILKEKQVLDTYFHKIKNGSVQLVVFSNDIHSEQSFQVMNGNWNLLRSAIDSIHYDGGTQLGALDLNKYSCDEFLFCSDGISNFGNADLELSATPVIAISSSQSADHSYLKFIAQSTNGQFINALSCSSEEAARLVGTQPYRFISAEYDHSKITEVYPSMPSDIKKTFTMSGILENGPSEIKLNFGFGNEIVYSEKIIVDNNSLTETGLVKRTWAQKKISELDVRYEKNKEEIAELGKKFSVVTRNTSLLILDRVDDYVTHRIVPPEKDLQKEYWAKVNEEEKMTKRTSKEHMEEVVRLFNERWDWWNKDFKPGMLKKHNKNSWLSSDSLSLEEGDYMGVAGSLGDQRDSGRRVYGYSNNVVNMTDSGGSSTYQWNFSGGNGGVEVSATDAAEGGTDGLIASPGLVASGNYNVVVTSSNGSASFSMGREKDESIAKEKEMDIHLKAWSAEAPYLDELKKSDRKNLYPTYLSLRKEHKDSPSFFLDAADYFFKQDEKAYGLRILSNLAELQLEDPAALRVLAHRLQQAGYLDLAIYIFRDVLKIREEEPQSYRDLGLALAEKKEYQEAVDVLCKVVNRTWDSRFPEVEVFVAGEINNIISSSAAGLKSDSLDKRLLKPMPVDMRVVINWDSDNCDIDLWVTDPLKEKCFYQNRQTAAGGIISKDFTGGYGPEEFMVKKSLSGKYLVQVNYYGTSQQTLFGPATVQAELYTNYGRPNQKKKEITIRLKEAKDVIDIGEMAYIP